MAALRSKPDLDFLDLPVEIRVKVYKYFFADTVSAFRPSDSRSDTKSFGFRCNAVHPSSWPLLRTCKQVYTEALPEYYRTTPFWITNIEHLRLMLQLQYFTRFVHHILFSGWGVVPSPSDLDAFQELETVQIMRFGLWEPIGTKPGHALDFTTLKRALRMRNFSPTAGMRTELSASLGLATALSDAADCRKPQVLIGIDYTYVEKADRPNTQIGTTARRIKSLVYNATRDFFTDLDCLTGTLVIQADVQHG